MIVFLMPYLLCYSHSTTIIPQLSPELRQAAVDSYADALRVVFICQAVLNFMCFLCCLPIQENPLPCVAILDSFPPYGRNAHCTCSYSGSHEEQEEAWKRRDSNRTESDGEESP